MERLSERDRAILNVIFDPFQAHGTIDISENENLDTLNQGEVDTLTEEVLNIVKEAISCAELNNFDKSFRLFNEALKKTPSSPAILNDRAQAFRLAGRDNEALEDLHMAVKLSQGKGKAGIQALCQRGILYRYMNEDQKAKVDFTLAAKAGSSFAKSQLVSLNPYAAMCNAMLQEITLKSMHH
ncbi:PREDICTED: tetratricopeptide repeat protein 36 homolog [Polistes dominula]|uniref:Tetratricopeptide repeat protein 36 homolog n=1 Tax=Polistes dominula TaxID=743375 RepID=A0ABM1IEW0_POLDO|nr:PREDICTED: tetratricopeptide repeat protein 36 homolog [Polistes dominula]